MDGEFSLCACFVSKGWFGYLINVSFVCFAWVGLKKKMKYTLLGGEIDFILHWIEEGLFGNITTIEYTLQELLLYVWELLTACMEITYCVVRLSRTPNPTCPHVLIFLPSASLEARVKRRIKRPRFVIHMKRTLFHAKTQGLAYVLNCMKKRKLWTNLTLMTRASGPQPKNK